METAKTKITEIKESYTKKTRVKDSSGNVQYENRTFTRYKEVVYVDGWARFGHYLLDTLFYYIFLVLVFGLLGVALGLLNMAHVVDRIEPILNLVTYLIIYPGYYFIFESTLQSTPAKLILGRVVVNEYGEKPTTLQILGRSYSRLVPFEVLSCLSETGWHDNWSKTYVLRKKDLYELELAIKAQEFDGKPVSSN